MDDTQKQKDPKIVAAEAAAVEAADSVISFVHAFQRFWNVLQSLQQLTKPKRDADQSSVNSE